MIKTTFLAENKTDNPGCLAEHGLSVYIETPEQKILFDTGASTVFAQNAHRLLVDLENADALVISHGHYDHTEGVPEFCRINSKAKVYIHEKAFRQTFGMKNGALESEQCGIRWSIPQFDELRSRLVLTRGVMKLTEDIVISGTIPDIEGYAPAERFFTKDENGGLTADPMDHEQFLAVRSRTESGKSKGIYIFSGCSHKGVVPCIRYAKELFEDEPILGFIAGMHLYSASKETRKRVLKEVAAAEIGLVVPVHCTGISAICDLKGMLGDRCIAAGAGDILTLD